MCPPPTSTVCADEAPLDDSPAEGRARRRARQRCRLPHGAVRHHGDARRSTIRNGSSASCTCTTSCGLGSCEKSRPLRDVRLAPRSWPARATAPNNRRSPAALPSPTAPTRSCSTRTSCSRRTAFSAATSPPTRLSCSRRRRASTSARAHVNFTSETGAPRRDDGSEARRVQHAHADPRGLGRRGGQARRRTHAALAARHLQPDHAPDLERHELHAHARRRHPVTGSASRPRRRREPSSRRRAASRPSAACAAAPAISR